MRVDGSFDLFHSRILLTETQRERIRSARMRLAEHLERVGYVDPGANDIVFLQGSFANGTAVRPADSDGEYDVDIVVVRRANTHAETPRDALAWLSEALERDADYKKRLAPNRGDRPCVRLRYADDDDGGFHVDVTPARHANSQAETPLDVPRPQSGWHGTHPEGFRAWCVDQGEPFARAVRMLKRWRDHNQDVESAIKSIVLQVLVARHLPSAASSDAERTAGALSAISAALSSHTSPPSIPNPVLASEDLSERWQNADYRAFKESLARSSSLAQRALSSVDPDSAHACWRDLFGPDFPRSLPSGPLSPPPPPLHRRPMPQEAPRVEWG